MRGWPEDWRACHGLIHLAKLWSGLAAPENVAGPELAQGSGDKLMLQKQVPVAGEGKTSLPAFQEVYVTFRVEVIAWKVLQSTGYSPIERTDGDHPALYS